MREVYADHAATTRVVPEALAALAGLGAVAVRAQRLRAGLLVACPQTRLNGDDAGVCRPS